MTVEQSVREALDALLPTVAALDLARPDDAQARLTRAHPLDSLRVLRELLAAAAEEGWLTPRSGGDKIAFGRLAKPSDNAHALSIDVVELEGPATAHEHPRGEVSLAFARHGDPRFDGHPEGWVVLPPGSRHVPTVEGGAMRIVYFLPNGEVRWG